MDFNFAYVCASSPSFPDQIIKEEHSPKEIFRLSPIHQFFRVTLRGHIKKDMIWKQSVPVMPIKFYTPILKFRPDRPFIDQDVDWAQTLPVGKLHRFNVNAFIHSVTGLVLCYNFTKPHMLDLQGMFYMLQSDIHAWASNWGTGDMSPHIFERRER